MQKNDRNPVRISDAFVIDVVNIGDLKHPRIKGLDLRIECGHMPLILNHPFVTSNYGLNYSVVNG